jgi:hypothetical protein
MKKLNNLLPKALIKGSDILGSKRVIEKFNQTKEIDKIISDTMNEHPYKERGNLATFSPYNEGWSDACDILGERIKEFLKK